MKILSLGWGVQSFTLAAMVALGELPPIGKLQPCECVPNLIHQKLAMENSPAYIPTPLTKPAH
jgi:hypothetical protein